MIALCKKFETKYFVYTEIIRSGRRALWKRESKLSDYIHWELVSIKHYPGQQNTRNLPKTKEYYPYYPEVVAYTEAEGLHFFKEWIIIEQKE